MRGALWSLSEEVVEAEQRSSASSLDFIPISLLSALLHPNSTAFCRESPLLIPCPTLWVEIDKLRQGEETQPWKLPSFLV